jgi:hypothetical protein
MTAIDNPRTGYDFDLGKDLERNIERKSINSRKRSNNRSEYDEGLQELHQQGEDLREKLIKAAEEGLECQRRRSLYPDNRFGGGGNSLTPEQVTNRNEELRFMNDAADWQIRYDIEKLMDKGRKILKGIKEQTDLFLQEKKQEKKQEKINMLSSAKKFDDIAALVEKNVISNINNINSKRVNGKQINSLSELKATGDLIKLEECLKNLEAHQIETEKITATQLEIARQRLENQEQILEDAENLYPKSNQDQPSSSTEKRQVEETRQGISSLEQLSSYQQTFNKSLDTFIEAYKGGQQIDIEKVRKKLEEVSKVLSDYEKTAAKVIRDNASYVQQQDKNSADLARGRLNEIVEEDSSEKIKDLLEQGETYLYYQPKAGKVVISGVFWPMWRIENIKRVPGKDQSKIQWDTNRAVIEIEESSTKAGKHKSAIEYGKTLASGYLHFGNTRVRFNTPDASGTERSEAKLIIEKKDDNGNWYVDEEKPIDLNAFRRLQIKINHTENDVQVTFHELADVVPDVPNGIMDHDKFRKAGTDGFEPEVAQRMFMIHLPSNDIILPHGRRMPLKDLQVNAIQMKEENPPNIVGPWVRSPGPTSDSAYISLYLAGLDLQSDELKTCIGKLDTGLRNYMSDAFKLLEDAFKRGDKNDIESISHQMQLDLALKIEEMEFVKNYFRDSAKDPLHKMPKKIDGFVHDLNNVQNNFWEKREEMYKALIGFNEKFGNKCIQVIDSKDITQREQLERDINEDVYHLKETFEVGSLNQLGLDEAIQKIAAEVGKAAHDIAEIEKPGTGKEAQTDAENKIIKDYIKVRDEYLKNENDKSKKSLEHFRTAMKDIFQYKIVMQAKAKIIEKAKEYAKNGKVQDQEKQEIIDKIKNDACKAEMEKVIREQKSEIKKLIKKTWLEDDQTDRERKARRYIAKVDEEVKGAMKKARLEKKSEVDQYKAGIESAIQTAFSIEERELDLNLKEVTKTAREAAKKPKTGQPETDQPKTDQPETGQPEFDLHMAAIKAGVEQVFKLKKYLNHTIDIRDEDRAEVNKLVDNAQKICIETLESERISIIGKYLKGDINSETREAIDNATEAKRKEVEDAGKNKFEQQKAALKAAIEKASGLDCIKQDRDVNEAIKKDKGEMDKEVEKEWEKALEYQEQVAIRKALGIKVIESEDKEKKLKEAIEKFERVANNAKNKVNKDWEENNNKRQNMVAKLKFDEFKKGYEKDIKNKETKEKKDLSQQEKDTIILNAAEEKLYKIISNSENVNKAKIEKIEEIEEIHKKIEGTIKENNANTPVDIGEVIKEETEKWVRELPITCKLNGAQLIQEWRKLKIYAKDSPDNLSLDKRRDHFLKQARRKQIEDIINNDPKVHYSYRMMLNAAKAYEAALEDNYFWREDSKKVKDHGVLYYLERVKTEVKAHKTDLGRLRGKFLHRVIEFVNSGISDAHPRQANRVLLPVLAQLNHTLEMDLDKLEFAKQALAGEISPHEAKEQLQKQLNAERQQAALSLDRVQSHQEKGVENKADQIEERFMKNGRFDFGELEKMKPSEIMKWRGNLRGVCEGMAKVIFEKRLEGLDPEQRAIEERNRHTSIGEIANQLWDSCLRTEKMLYDIYRYERLAKESDRQRRQDFFYSWFLLGMQGFNASGARTVNVFMKELQKLLGMSNS